MGELSFQKSALILIIMIVHVVSGWFINMFYWEEGGKQTMDMVLASERAVGRSNPYTVNQM